MRESGLSDDEIDRLLTRNAEHILSTARRRSTSNEE
ncbi:hypothetical protein M2260_000036 [Rhodococcus erythropolis]|nr:hypothetical protein [Rhodococcus erythropolis]